MVYFYNRTHADNVEKPLIPFVGSKDIHYMWSLSNNILALLAFMKIFSYLRASESLSKMTILITKVFVTLIPFNFVFFALSGIISITFILSGAAIHSSDDFPDHVPFGLSEGVQAFRNSIGDIAPPTFETWDDQEGGLIMVFWICLQFLLSSYIQNIILLNFLIAQISQSYDDVIGKEELHMVRNMVDCNVDSAILLDAFTTSKGVTQSFYVSM